MAVQSSLSWIKVFLCLFLNYWTAEGNTWWLMALCSCDMDGLECPGCRWTPQNFSGFVPCSVQGHCWRQVCRRLHCFLSGAVSFTRTTPCSLLDEVFSGSWGVFACCFVIWICTCVLSKVQTLCICCSHLAAGGNWHTPCNTWGCALICISGCNNLRDLRSPEVSGVLVFNYHFYYQPNS